jgi:hypothetical protein
MAITDDFNRGTLGSNWTNQALGGSAVGIVANVAVCTTGSSFAGMYWGAHTWNADHHSKITITGTLTYAAAGVRHSGSGAGTNFYAYFSHGSLQKFVNSAQSILASGGTTAPAGAVNGTIELDVVGNSTIGNTLRTTKDGVPGTVLSPADFALNAGAPGIAWYSTGAGADNWVGTGEVVSTGVYVLPASPVTYATSGTAATLKAARRVAAAATSYTYTGTAATLTKSAHNSYALPAAPGAYALTALDVGLRTGRRLVAEASPYTITGTAAVLRGPDDVLPPGDLVTTVFLIHQAVAMTATVRTTVTMTAER